MSNRPRRHRRTSATTPASALLTPAGTTRGEDVLDKQGTEAGREHTGTDDESGAERPTGESGNRDQTSVDPHDGTTDRTAG